MKKARTLLGSTLALSFLITGCGSEPGRAARGGGDLVIARGGQAPKQIVCAPGSFSGGNECIPIKVAECPQGTVARDGQCVEPTPEKVQVATPPETIQLSSIDREYGALIDPRKAWQEPRARQLLITEIQGLEALFQSIPKDGPDRPKLIRRLSEGYVELESAAVRTGLPTEDVQRRRLLTSAARKSATKYYRLLLDGYPKFCTLSTPVKPSGCGDEVLYFMALEYIRADSRQNARNMLLILVKDWPQSDKIGPAYFLFGEMFREEGERDPSLLEMAKQAYAKVVAVGGPLKGAAAQRLDELKGAQSNP